MFLGEDWPDGLLEQQARKFETGEEVRRRHVRGRYRGNG
jgi:hypothetical protein